jgi:hypothetical protein
MESFEVSVMHEVTISDHVMMVLHRQACSYCAFKALVWLIPNLLKMTTMVILAITVDPRGWEITTLIG